MSRLDDCISDLAYILDCLKTLRSIQNSGECITCEAVKDCKYVPEPGQLTRYNCPFYEPWMYRSYEKVKEV